MAKSLFEEMGGTYTRVGDYLLPDLKLSEKDQRPIGIWGQRRLHYLKEHKKGTYIALDYFDASINRISAWVTGYRAFQKALLNALLEPAGLKELQDSGDFTGLMVALEEQKTLPFGDVWSEYLKRQNVPEDYLTVARDYEKNVLAGRN